MKRTYGSFGSLIILLFSCIYFTACTSSFHETKKSLKQGQLYKDSITINGNIVPLGPGDWYLVSYKAHPTRLIEALLFNVQGNKLHSRIRITSKDISAYRSGYKKCKYCERKDIHFIKNYANLSGKNQECWLVNHITRINYFEEDARQFIKTHHLQTPKTMIQTFHHFAEVDNFLDVMYEYNPEIEGFPPDKSTSWPDSDWSIIATDNDKERKKYITNIKKKGADYHSLLKQGRKQ